MGITGCCAINNTTADLSADQTKDTMSSSSRKTTDRLEPSRQTPFAIGDPIKFREPDPLDIYSIEDSFILPNELLAEHEKGSPLVF